jgi:hypothetical protein
MLGAWRHGQPPTAEGSCKRSAAPNPASLCALGLEGG